MEVFNGDSTISSFGIVDCTNNDGTIISEPISKRAYSRFLYTSVDSQKESLKPGELIRIKVPEPPPKGQLSIHREFKGPRPPCYTRIQHINHHQDIVSIQSAIVTFLTSPKWREADLKIYFIVSQTQPPASVLSPKSLHPQEVGRIHQISLGFQRKFVTKYRSMLSKNSRSMKFCA